VVGIDTDTFLFYDYSYLFVRRRNRTIVGVRLTICCIDYA